MLDLTGITTGSNVELFNRINQQSVIDAVTWRPYHVISTVDTANTQTINEVNGPIEHDLEDPTGRGRLALTNQIRVWVDELHAVPWNDATDHGWLVELFYRWTRIPDDEALGILQQLTFSQ